MAGIYNFIIDPKNPPAPEEFHRWNVERSHFTWHPENAHAPAGSIELHSWGFHPTQMPPADAVEYAMAMFKTEKIQCGLQHSDGRDIQLLPGVKWAFVMICAAHFYWLRTASGAPWLMRFYGVEEVKRFTEGYRYLYTHPTTRDVVDLADYNLRIFRRCERNLGAPIDATYTNVVEELRDVLRVKRDKRVRTPMPIISNEMWKIVSELIRDWFTTMTPDKQFPKPKPTRISGYQWARQVKRSDGEPLYGGLINVESFRGRAYRIAHSQQQGQGPLRQYGSVFWCRDRDVVVEPLPDFYRNNRVDEREVLMHFQCSSCHHVRPCLPVTAEAKMCCHCYGSTVQTDTRTTLGYCTMEECNKCPDYIKDEADLVHLKNHLNRGIEFPVRRHG